MHSVVVQFCNQTSHNNYLFFKITYTLPFVKQKMNKLCNIAKNVCISIDRNCKGDSLWS